MHLTSEKLADKSCRETEKKKKTRYTCHINILYPNLYAKVTDLTSNYANPESTAHTPRTSQPTLQTKVIFDYTNNIS